MCFGCSKEPSHRDGPFEYPQHMFWLRNKKNNFSYAAYALLSGGLHVGNTPRMFTLKPTDTIVMHQSFVSTAPPPKGMVGIVTFNFSEPWYKPHPVGTS